MKRLWIVFWLFALGASGALAAGKELNPGTLMEPRPEVLEHIESRWPHYELEDYCEIVDTPKGDYGFALLRASGERMLVGYYEEDGEMVYWLKNHGAVPQGTAGAWFDVDPKGTVYYDAQTDETRVHDGLTLSVYASYGESYDKGVSYRWENGGFALSSYHDWDEAYRYVTVEKGKLSFRGLEGEEFGYVYGDVQRDIRYVSFAALPKSERTAKQELSVATHVKAGELEAKEIRFTGGRKYDVYTGPGTQYARSGNGKGSVSTNDWIEVFGEENGFIMVQYDIAADHFRIGWIDARALPDGVDVELLHLGDANPYQEIVHACALTDDPLRSGAEVVWLDAGTKVYYLCNFGRWDYIEVEIGGILYRGFVPETSMTHG